MEEALDLSFDRLLMMMMKFQTVFQHVSAVATNIIKERLLYNLKHCSIKNCLSYYAHTVSPILMLMCAYFGARCLALHTLLYQIVALVLSGLSLVFCISCNFCLLSTHRFHTVVYTVHLY